MTVIILKYGGVKTHYLSVAKLSRNTVAVHAHVASFVSARLCL